jgi:hypothetical protein
LLGYYDPFAITAGHDGVGAVAICVEIGLGRSPAV